MNDKHCVDIYMSEYSLILVLQKRRIGHFAWYSNHTMSQWVKLRGEFAAYSFVSQQMALYLCIAV